MYKAFFDLGSWYDDAPKQASDGSFEDGAGNKATATRLREAKDLRFKWRTSGSPDETEVDVTFPPRGNGKPGITLMHNRIQTREEADGLRRAWSEAFDRMKAKLEG
jgi:uncharacterized protein YndB with AHSA1/START domain